MNHGNVPKDATAIMAKADNTAKKVSDAMLAEHAEYFRSGEVQKY